MLKYIIALLFYLTSFHTMTYSKDKPYHHITDKKGNIIEFRNPEGSPQRGKGSWSFSKFNNEKKNT